MAESLRSIPLSQLVPSDHNVRRTEATAGLEELAASIAAHGLLQNLTVRSLAKKNGKPSGKFAVVAGGRRLAALNLLLERQQIADDFSVPCHVLDGADPVEVSLAENVVRAPLHPADQFEAFAKLFAEGKSAEDIAARFGVTADVVVRRLKLAAVSARLMAEYREGRMNLDQLMAFTITDDQEAQESVWFGSPLHDRSPQSIRRALTREHVRGSDRQARFVGQEAYEKAGGTILQDLFDPDEGAYFTNPALLECLVSEKLTAEAEKVRSEGWAWVEVQPDIDYGYLARFRRLEATPLPEEDQTRLNELSEEYDSLVADVGDEPSPEFDERLNRLSAEIDQISTKLEQWTPEQKAEAGAVLTIEPSGALRVDRGLLKPGEKPKANGSHAEPESQDASDGPTKKDRPTFSDALVEDLTAHRTAGLRETLAANPQLALAALLHALILRTFFGAHRTTCVELELRTVDLRSSAAAIAESPAAIAMAERHQGWLQRLPQEADLLPWLAAQDLEVKLELLAYCTATAVNAVRRRFDNGAERIDQADALAILVGLDMTQWWRPTKASYLGRVSKAQILAAVSEAVASQAAQEIAELKKDAMADRAQQLLADTRWLPQLLRTPSAPHNGASAEQARS